MVVLLSLSTALADTVINWRLWKAGTGEGLEASDSGRWKLRNWFSAGAG
jgi:hypothetical protein